MAKKVLTLNLSEPLGFVTTAKVDINTGDGNLMIDQLSGSEQLLASGTLQYLENQELPNRSLVTSNDQATLSLKSSGKGQTWLHLPWSTCNGATEWQVHLNPAVRSEITACSDGGNIKLDLAGMVVTRILAATGGGNMDVILPENSANLSVNAKTGAGNVTVEIGSGTTGNNTIDANSGAGNVVIRVPEGMAARVSATVGLGKAIIDPRFCGIDGKTYESLDYDSAVNKVNITAKSGAGNVIVERK